MCQAAVKHSPCKHGVPGLSPGLTSHFSYPVTFGAQQISNLWGCMSRYRLIHHKKNNVSDCLKHSPCKQGVPGSSPDLTAHFSYPVTNMMSASQYGTMTMQTILHIL